MQNNQDNSEGSTERNVHNVTFTPEKARRLKDAYIKALADGKDTFVFEGNTYVVGYAKYLLQYLEMQWKTKF